MNPPSTSLPITFAAPAAVSGGGENSELIQLDSGSPSGFPGVWDQVVASQSTPAPAVAEDAQAVLADLQSLPQGGKLLPLLEATLEKVAASGIDMKRFVERLGASVKQLMAAGAQLSDQSPAQQLALILQPLVAQQPGLQAVLPPEVATALAGVTVAENPGEGRPLRAVSGDAAGAAARAAPPPRADTLSPTGDSGATPPRDPRVAADPMLFSQQLPAPGNDGAQARAPELAALMATLRRLSPDTSRTPSADSSPVAATAPVSAATGSQPNAAVAVPVMTLNTPFGQADWDQALSERIQWLASQKLQGAQVKLNPAHLGPMEVRVQVQNDQASIQFNAHHAGVREALEASLPRLRDMFEASGVQLINVDISGGAFSGQRRAEDGAAANWSGGGDSDEPLPVESVKQTPLAAFLGSGRLDLFA